MLRNLFDRLHGPNADYPEALTRDVVLNIILQALSSIEHLSQVPHLLVHRGGGMWAVRLQRCD